MKIHNVRLGLATNSSSTHSIIFTKNRVKDKDVEGREFGWDLWTAASKEAKRQYVAIHLLHAIRGQVSKDVADAVLEQWIPGVERPVKEDDEFAWDEQVRGYVDHQSEYVLPRAWDGAGVDKAFFEDFRDFFLRDDVVILGGNDNDDETHELGKGFVLPITRDGGAGDMVARKDEQGGYWTLFDRNDGTKIRFSFDTPTSRKEVTKASAPELVDIKITDFCPYNCAFCYQGSTGGGKHADVGMFYRIAETLGQLRVFEVAIGGGEPTLHPKFLQILDAFKSRGIVANFTTKNLAWLRDAMAWPKIMEKIGAFAFSVDDEKDVEQLAALLEVNGIDTSQASVQYVMGSTDVYKMERIIEKAADARLRITLLGYKTTGRGSSFKPQPYKDWVKRVKKLYEQKHYFTLGIDTALAKESGGELADERIPTKLYATDEGKFSMYIDAVDGKIAASSYVEDIAMKRADLQNLTKEKLVAAFAEW